MSGLEYWASVARGADVAPLRARLLKLELKRETHAYIHELDDEGLRDRLIRRITWDCGQGGLEDLEAEIEAKLLRSALPGIRIEPHQLRRVTSALVEQTLRTAVSVSPRRLSTVDLHRSIKSVTHTEILTTSLTALIDRATGQGGGVATNLRLRRPRRGSLPSTRFHYQHVWSPVRRLSTQYGPR